ncbi:MAG: universal stress protein [Armatimonadota bacterium]
MPLRTILLATDGSAGAQAAARQVAELPLESDALVTLLCVQEDPEHDPSRVLAETAELFRYSTAALKRDTETGHPAETILRVADELHPDLLVLGASGRSGIARFFLGSVSERVARHAQCPVLVARGGDGPIGRVIVGIDESETADRLVPWLADLPLPAESELRLVTLIPNLHAMAAERMSVAPPLSEAPEAMSDWMRDRAQERLSALAAGMRARGRRAATEIRSGDPARGLMTIASDESAGLLVIGAGAEGALERFLLGSVSERVVRHAPCSVLVFRPAVGR